METRSERIQKDVEAINAFTATPGRGITRFTFSPEYAQARAYVVAELKKIGARVSTALGGSLRGRLEGSGHERASVMMGSHIDSVFQGGRFDGVAGVVAALEAARVIMEKKIPHRHPIDVVVFAEEEGSRFGSVMLGSRAWVGKISFEELGRTRDRGGISFAEAMAGSGIVADAPAILRPAEVKAMLELHIEQSVVLHGKGIQVGIVEAINGIKQFVITVQGVANHAGGTPMELRADALQGAARIFAAAEEMAVREMGKNTVATVGFVRCEPGQANVIPGKVEFTLDIRNPDPVILEKAAERMMVVIAETCRQRNLAYQITPGSDTPPTVLSAKIGKMIEEAARGRKIPTLRMVSGPLHDSSILGELVETGMIFVPSRDGRSHCPEEFTELADLKAGADILLDVAVKLAE